MKLAQALSMSVSQFPDFGLQLLAFLQLGLKQGVALLPVALERPERFHLVLLLCFFIHTAQTIPQPGETFTQARSSITGFLFQTGLLSSIQLCALGGVGRLHGAALFFEGL